MLQKGKGQSPEAHAISTIFTSWDLEGLSSLNLSLFLCGMGLQPAMIQQVPTQDHLLSLVKRLKSNDKINFMKISVAYLIVKILMVCSRKLHEIMKSSQTQGSCRVCMHI